MFYIKHGLDQFIVQHEEKLLNRTDKTNNFYLSRKCYFNAKSLTKEKKMAAWQEQQGPISFWDRLSTAQLS
jgi:hypothetical protein